MERPLTPQHWFAIVLSVGSSLVAWFVLDPAGSIDPLSMRGRFTAIVAIYGVAGLALYIGLPKEDLTEKQAVIGVAGLMTMASGLLYVLIGEALRSL